MMKCMISVGCVSLVFAVLGLTSDATAQITEIIDGSGDGAGNSLIRPRGVAVDDSGNFYLAGFASDNVFRVTEGGVVSVLLDINGPRDVAVDGVGNVFVAACGVSKVALGGTITEIIGFLGDGEGNLLVGARCVVVDGSGNVYVTGEFTDNAFKITPDGTITEIIDETGDGAGNELQTPTCIAVDSSENVYVVGYLSSNAFKITPGGTITEIIDQTGAGTGFGLDSPLGIAVDGTGNAYVSGQFSSNVLKITPGGVITEIIDSFGDGAGNRLGGGGGLAVDGSGNVYVSGDCTHNAFRITPGGTITEILDETGDGAGHVLRCSADITVDGSGTVYVSGTSSNNAFKILPNPCNLGTVNGGVGPTTEVLFVNGGSGTVTVATGEPITIAMNDAPAGSGAGLYVLWLWVGAPTNCTELMAGGELLGCTALPTPLNPGITPQPFRCLRSPQLPCILCGSVMELPAPAAVPWTVTKGGGFAAPALFNLQGLVRDMGAGNPTGFSVTNGVILKIE